MRNDTASFLPANAPSVLSAKLAAPFLAPSGATGVLVATDTAGPLTPTDLSAIKVVEDRALRSPLVVSVGGGRSQSMNRRTPPRCDSLPPPQAAAVRGATL